MESLDEYNARIEYLPELQRSIPEKENQAEVLQKEMSGSVVVGEKKRVARIDAKDKRLIQRNVRFPIILCDCGCGVPLKEGQLRWANDNACKNKYNKKARLLGEAAINERMMIA